MDIFSLYHVRQGVLKAGVQTGKTQGMHILVAREADYSNGNDNALIVMADEKSVKKLSGNRLIPLFTESPALKQLVSSNPDDTAIYSIKLTNNFRLDIGWATSEVSVSSEAYRILVLDEIAKYQQQDNIADMKGRTNTYEETCKRWILSSPDLEGSPLDEEFDNSDVIFDYHPICPHCGEAQIMTFDRFEWPGKDTGTGKAGQIRMRKEAVYHCKECGMPWDDNDRDMAVLAAMNDGEYRGWRPREYVERFRSASAHYPSWISPFMSLSEVVAQWLEAQGKPGKLKKWHNTIAGESWAPKEVDDTSLDGLVERKESYAPIVPMDAAQLTAGGDVQADRIEIEVVAWGLNNESWGMAYEVLYGDTSLPDVWERLDAYLLETWRHESGEDLKIERAFIDAGYRDQMVHRFTGKRNGRGIFSCKGAKAHDAPELTGPVKIKLGAARVNQYSIGTQKIKTQMFASFGLNATGSNYCHIPDTYPDNWYSMMQAEKLVKKNLGGRDVYLYEKKTQSSRNEAIDCRAYATAAYMSIRNNNIKEKLERLKAIATKVTEKILPVNTSSKYKRPGGFVGGWK